MGIRLFRAAPLVGLLVLGACQGGGGFVVGGASPAGVPIAIESVDAPSSVQTALAGELASAASKRQVDLAGADAPARYRVRGYLSAEPTPEGGTALAYVWEVFDADKRRAKRLAGTAPLKAATENPWDGLDREALARLAAQSMDEIATFLAEVKARGGAAVTAEALTEVEAAVQ